MSNTKEAIRIRKLVYAAICLALAMLLPFLTGQVPQFGKALCPMHIPAFLCGFICGPVWGAVVGFISPLLRYMLFGMPILIPTGLSMVFELAVYGALSGILYKVFPKKTSFIYVSLVISMLVGRIVAGISMYFIMMGQGKTYTMSTFISVNFITAIPGIILHIVVVPVIVIALKKAKLI